MTNKIEAKKFTRQPQEKQTLQGLIYKIRVVDGKYTYAKLLVQAKDKNYHIDIKIDDINEKLSKPLKNGDIIEVTGVLKSTTTKSNEKIYENLSLKYLENVKIIERGLKMENKDLEVQE